jgi:AcrR family transcriptional regulator
MRADARRNRERILAAARQAFAEEGAGAQMESIARRAGVGVGTLYRNFPTRRALVAEMNRAWAEERSANAERALAIDDPWAAVEDFVRRGAAAMNRDARLREVFADLPAKEVVPEVEAAFEERLARLIDRAHQAGVLRAEITPAAFRASMVGLSAAIAAGNDWRLAADMLLAGLRAPGDRPPPEPARRAEAVKDAEAVREAADEGWSAERTGTRRD